MNPSDFSQLIANKNELKIVAETFKIFGEAKGILDGRGVHYVATIKGKTYEFDKEQAKKICESLEKITPKFAQERIKYLKKVAKENALPKEFLVLGSGRKTGNDSYQGQIGDELLTVTKDKLREIYKRTCDLTDDMDARLARLDARLARLDDKFTQKKAVDEQFFRQTLSFTPNV